VFELSFGGDPFGRDLAYLVRLVAARKIDPQLAGELPWDQMPAALERLRNRDVAGKLSNWRSAQTMLLPGTPMVALGDSN
jgi:hypothetical protein